MVFIQTAKFLTRPLMWLMKKSPPLFSQLPSDIQMDVLKKVDYKDFLKFRECSKESAEITKNFKHLLPLKVFELELPYLEDDFKYALEEPVRLEVQNAWLSTKLSDEQFLYLQNFCQKKKLIAENLCLKGDSVEHDPTMIDSLIKLLNSPVLNLHSCSSSFLPGIKELEKLKRLAFFAGEMKDSDFLLLKTPEIALLYSEGVTYRAVNSFLKQWLNGERTLKNLYIGGIRGGHSEIFNDLELALLWSSERPTDGSFAHLRRHIKERKLAIYSLERKDREKIFFGIEEFQFETQFFARKYEDDKEIEQWFQNGGPF